MDYVSVQPTTVRHKVGMCPACRDYLWAEVDIRVVVGEPTLDTDGKAHVYASPRLVAMRVEHSCAEDEGDTTADRRPEAGRYEGGGL